MIGKDVFVFALGALFAFAGLPGCTTTRTDASTHASSAVTASTGSVAVSVSSETTTVMRSTTPPPPPAPTAVVPSAEIQPRNAIAADAQGFVEPASK